MSKKNILLLLTVGSIFVNSFTVLAGDMGRMPQMTLENYPRIDGSLACVPLCEALAKEITGCSDFEAEDTMAEFTNTNPCYEHLANGERYYPCL